MDDASLDLALGPRLTWSPCQPPAREPIHGDRVDLVPMSADAHADALWQAVSGPDADPDLWLYLGNGPYADETAFTEAIRAQEASADPLFFAIVPHGSDPCGQASYMRIDAANGVIEIGHIWMGGRIQRSPIATEAIYLLARHVFDDLGYRRLEWKTTARNERSRNAALRFGFSFEGIFRNHLVIRDRNRDTAWYAMTDDDWPAVKAAFEEWLADDNFDDDGAQKRSLRDIREQRS